MKNGNAVNQNNTSSGKKMPKLDRKRFDLPAFIVCVLVAIVIWLIVYNSSDIAVTKSYTYQIKIEGQYQLEKEHKLSILNVNDKMVKVSFEGAPRQMRDYLADDISVVLDVSQITHTGQNMVVPTVVFPDGKSFKVTSMEPAAISVSIDDLAEKDIPFEAKLGAVNTETPQTALRINKDYSKFIHISGPQTIVSGIVKAEYPINQSNVTEDTVYKNIVPIFMDINGMPVSAEQNITYDTSNLSIDVSIIRLETKTIEFDALVGSINIPENYKFNIVTDDSNLIVTGPKELIQKIAKASYTLNPGEVTGSLNVKGFTPTFYDNNGDEITDVSELIYNTKDLHVQLKVTTEKLLNVVMDIDNKAYSWRLSNKSPTTVKVIGEPKVISELKEYRLKDIENALNSGSTLTTFTHKISVSNLGVEGVDIAESGVDITVYIDKK